MLLFYLLMGIARAILSLYCATLSRSARSVMSMPPWNERLLARLVTSHCFLCVLTICPLPTFHTPWSHESMSCHDAAAACTCVSS